VSGQPTILDALGNRLEVGMRVVVNDRDESLVDGFEFTWLGWRVKHTWLTGHHPDESEPSERTAPIETPRIDGDELLRRPDLKAVLTPDLEEKR